MATRPILVWQSSSTLREPSRPVTFDPYHGRSTTEVFSAAELRELVADLRDTMRSCVGQDGQRVGVGLAAPQIGVNARVAVIDTQLVPMFRDRAIADDLLVLVNPAARAIGTKTERTAEGCLSFPSLSTFVERPKVIEVRYLDEAGAVQFLTAAGFPARVLLHEIDHLDGRTIADCCSPTNREILLRKTERISVQVAAAAARENLGRTDAWMPYARLG